VILSPDIVEAARWVGIGLAVVFIALLRFATGGRRWRAVVFLLGIPLSLVLGFALGVMGVRTIIVKIPRAASATSSGWWAVNSPPYKFQDGHEAKLTSGGAFLVVNDSARPIEIRTVRYGVGFGDPVPTPIPPMSTFDPVYDLNFVGPENRPPDHVTGHIAETRYWLTW